MTRISRRDLIAGLAVALTTPVAAPAIAQSNRWSAARAAARGLPQLHAILIAHQGREVVAERVRGPSLERPAAVKSVSKSIVALLLGAAIDRRIVPSVSATLAEVAPSLVPQSADPRVPDLTMEDLVTMRAGLERTSGANYGGWVASRNWVADALSRPFVAEPGERMLYSTGSFHVLGAALAEAAGEDLRTLAQNWLGRPLGVAFPPWLRDPQGYYMGGNAMALRPRDMLAIGELVRRGGAVGDAQVISKDWIEASLTPVTQSQWSGLGYGYGWFIEEQGAGPIAIARGYGGQIIATAPEAEITVVVTSDPTRPARSAGYFGDLMDLLTGPVLNG